MNRKLLSLLVTLVAMFGCLGNIQAQEYTVTLNQSSNKAFTGENGGVTFSITNLGNWENATDANNRTNKHCAGYKVNANTNSIITWSGAPDGYVIAFSKIEVKGTSTSDKNTEKGMDLLTSNSTLKAATVSCNTNQPQTISINNSLYCRFDNTGSLTIQHGGTDMYVNEVSLTYKIIENKYVWKWLGEDLSNNNEYYLRNTLSGKFAKKASTDMVADVTSDDLFKISFRKDNEYYIINKNNKYVAWGNDGFNLNVNSDDNSVRIIVVTKYYSYSFNKYGDNYQIAYDNNSYLYSDGTTLAKDDNMSDNLQTYWQLISNDQMDKYNRYIQAHAAAEALGDGEDDATKEQLEQIIAQYENANKDNADDKIAGLNSIAKAKMTVSGQAHYGTFAAPFEVELEDGITAWDVTKVEDDKAVITQVNSPIPAYQPVILHNGSNTVFNKVYFGVTKTKVADKSQYLVGVYDEDLNQLSSEEGYMLQYDKDNKKCEFRKGNNQKVSKNRAYLKVTTETAAGVKFRLVMPDETTEVSSVNAGAEVSSVYSLSGIKLDKMQKGVNIIKMSDGSFKKIIVK